MKILIIEDESMLGQSISSILNESGWQAEWVPDGEKGLALAKTGSYDLVLLDVLLPGLNGWEVCQALRKSKINVPIMMLTAMDEVEDRVKGLNLGADDYLSKPFNAVELIARVNALLRRDRLNKGNVISIDNLIIDLHSKLVERGGRTIDLTRREFDLLALMAANEGKILSKERIPEDAWNDDDVLSNTVEVFVSSLRKKIDREGDRKLIHTVHGFGYVLRIGN